jgi:hypothetical protein
VLKTQHAHAAGARQYTAVTRSDTASDSSPGLFGRYGKHDIAFEAMPRVIENLINKSIGDRCAVAASGNAAEPGH